MENTTYDIAIIGGGIIGLATAMALAEAGRRRLIVLEAEDRLAAHQTGNNSGVIHSGLYYKPGSRKARNCVEGRELLYRFCQEHGVAHDRCGKVVVATSEAELPALDVLHERGTANGLKGLRKLAAEEVREFEPHVAALGGLLVPETGIVDFVGATRCYGVIVQQHGGQITKHARVDAVRNAPAELVLETTAGAVHCRNLINCGGLESDRVARLCGLKPEVQIVPFRGEYYELIPDRTHLVTNLIYPVPDPRFPFLGVHFTRMALGGVEAGPNAVLALKREGYKWSDVSPADLWEMATFRGFWRLVARHWKTGMGEFYRSLSKAAFVRQLQRLIPELQAADLQPGGAGVRAQAVDRTGALVDDFSFLEADRMIHVLNAPSPAATASISIGRTIAELAGKNFQLDG